MFFGANKVLGLDIGSSSIKIAELDVSKNGAKLVNFGMAQTPPNSINGGDISDPGALSVAIKSLIMDMKSGRKNAAVGMFGTAVIVKKITIPRIDLKLVGEQVKWEAEQYIPFDVNSISLAHHVINPKDQSETMDILLIAAQNELVAEYYQVVQMADLKMGILDVSAFALANVFEFNYGRPEGQTVGIVNLGSAITNFVVISNGEVVFSRDMPIGGQNYTNDIHKEMSVSVPEAESLKLSAATGGAVPDEVHRVISSTTEQVTEEIRNSFDFFAGSSGGLSISQVYYTGGAAATPGLIRNLTQATRLEMEWLNPFRRITSGNKKISTMYLEQITPFCAVAFGLGLRKVGD